MLAALCLFVAVSGCATRSNYEPMPIDQVGFLDRSQTKTKDGVTVTVAALSPEETRAAFAAKLDKKWVQPVWIEITNDTDEPFWFIPRSVDPDYFSPLEAAWMSRKKYTKQARQKVDRYFYETQMRIHVPPNSTRSGFVYVNQTLGVRHVLVELLGADASLLRFDFMVEVPGLKTDYEQVDFETLYEEFEDLDDEGLRRWLAEQACCTTNKDGSKQGDPLNIVVVGTSEAVWPAFVRVGWDVTEPTTSGSMWRTVKSSLFGKNYRTSPISSLFTFGRPQDIGLQKARKTVDERNHLRLWLAPVTWRGELVWLGQISRDIGVRITTKSPTLTTHKIDPDVDETRVFLVQDLLYSQGIARMGYAEGVGEATVDEPRGNLTGDPYFTDGLRVILFMSEQPVSLVEVEVLDWATPRER
jgi:hypothetical protein